MANLWAVLQAGLDHYVLPDGQAVVVNPVVPAVYPYLASNGEFVEADATAGVVTVNLPTPGVPGDVVRVKKMDATANAVTVSGNGLNIDAAATYPLPAQWDVLTVVRGTTQWLVT
jgi:hypothetical protein